MVTSLSELILVLGFASVTHWNLDLAAIAGIIAAIGSVLYNTEYPVCVGASGAVFGIIGAMLWLVLKNRGTLQGISKKRMLFFVFLSVYGGFTSQGVDNAAHIAGLFAGFLLTMVITIIEKKGEVTYI